MTSNESNLLSINPIGKIIGPDGKEYTCSQVIAEIAKIEREIQNQKKYDQRVPFFRKGENRQRSGHV